MKVYSKPVTFSQPHKVHWPPSPRHVALGPLLLWPLSLLFRLCVVRLLHRTLRYQVSLFAEEDAATRRGGHRRKRRGAQRRHNHG